MKEKEKSRIRTHELVCEFIVQKGKITRYHFLAIKKAWLTERENKAYRAVHRTLAKDIRKVKLKNLIAMLFLCISLSSCATLLGGSKTDHQRNAPGCDEPKRRVRVGFLIADVILFPPGLIIDFCTKKIYKPYPNPNKIKKCEGGAK